MNGASRIILAAMAASSLGAGAPRGDVFPYPIDQKVFDNGLQLVGVRFDSPGLVAYYTVVRVGSRHEVEPGRSGFAHFFEHMMFRGTEKYPEERYNAVLQSIGADSNANTSFDRTIYHILASKDALPTIVEIEADRFRNLRYSEEQFRKEAGAVLGEYNKSASNPFMALFEKLHATAYEVHPYRHMVIGFLEDIQAMPSMYDFSLEFFDRFYRPEYTTILVVGDYDWPELVRWVTEDYGDWKRGEYVAEIRAEPPREAPREASIEWSSPALPHLVVSYPAPAFSTEQPDMPALDVLSQVFFGETSAIFQELVIEKQWVDFIQAGAFDQADPTLFNITTRVREPERLEAVRERILAEVERTRTEAADPERLATTKSHMKYQFLLGLDTADAVASTLAHYLALTQDPASVNEVYALYDRVSAEDLQRVARTYFRPEGRTIVTLQQAPGVKGEE